MNSEKIIKEISTYIWIKRWVQLCTLTSPSFWGPQYNKIVKDVLGIGLNNTLFIQKKGVVVCLMRKDELDKLGKFLADKVSKYNQYAIDMCNGIKKNTDKINTIMDRLSNKIPTKKEFDVFYRIYEDHISYQVFLKKTIDYLSPDLFNKLEPYFHDARVYSEKVYGNTELFFKSINKKIAKKEDYDEKLLSCLTKNEFMRYLDDQMLPNKLILKGRYAGCVLYSKNSEEIILLGNDVEKVEKAITDAFFKNSTEIKGIVAFKGKVKGTVKIIHDPSKPNDFSNGDILVSGQTNPDFMQLIKKASAIITDSGGILCHAAIISRELKIPCIVGTEIATHVLKTGMVVEVDADKGIVIVLDK
ncbi:MAG: PEP-utilizing enzyme [Candidatus Woesearchaeota archaeon]